MQDRSADRADRPADPGRRAPLKVAAALAASCLVLGALAILARELIAARIPEQRAALQALVRHETGLDVSFQRLSVRFGWYGPEAVFHEVTLAEPQHAALVHAAELVVILDPWRSARSGQLEPARIRLLAPDFDLRPHARAALASGAAGAADGTVADAGRLLAQWRGGRIDVEEGTLSWSSPAGAPVSLRVRRAELRRLGSRWSAFVRLALPETLGESAQLALSLSGDPARPSTLSGAVTASATALNFAGCKGLAPALAWLPAAGRGSLTLKALVRGGRLVSAAGTANAAALAFAARAAGAPGLEVPSLRADWQLAREPAGWRLSLAALQLDPGEDGAALLRFTPAGAQAQLRHIPLAPLTALVRFAFPATALPAADLSGSVDSAQISWNGDAAPGERLQLQAQLDALTLGDAAHAAQLSGLSAALSATDAAVQADVRGAAARLSVSGAAPQTLEGLKVRLPLAAELDGTRWRVHAADVELSRAPLLVRAALESDGEHLSAHVSLAEADAALLAAVLHDWLPFALPGGVTAGRISEGALDVRLPLGAAATAASHGFLVLRDAALRGAGDWPDAEGLAGRLEWHGAALHATLSAARSGGLTLVRASAERSARGEVHISGRLAGSAAAALGWLHTHAQFARAAPLAAALSPEGDALLNVSLSATRAAPLPRLRVSAALQGVRLQPVAGLPPLEDLHGTLSFAGGALERSSLSGRWLAGPVAVGISERRTRAGAQLVLAAHGVTGVREALAVLGAPSDTPLSGSTEWQAQLSIEPSPGAPTWTLRADSTLAGLTSGLPEPLAKSGSTSLPVRLEMHGGEAAAQLRLAVGERLQGLAELEAAGTRWRIARAALRLGAALPALPQQGLMQLDGRLRHLDLPAYLVLWRRALADPRLPPLAARLEAGELALGDALYGSATLEAHSAGADQELSVRAPQLEAALRIGAGGAARLTLKRWELAELGDAGAAVALGRLLGPRLELTVDELRVDGRALGRLTASFSDGTLAALELEGAAETLHASGRCQDATCRAQFSLDSTDAAHTLGALGFRADVSAARARLAGELEWPAAAAKPLATLNGHLHMQIDTGTLHGADAGGAEPLGLLLVPALIGADAARGPAAEVNFARLSADYELQAGQAHTANLHLDGDAEILMRARIGLAAHDYEGEAVVLRGEERLPAALRHLAPSARMAALWMSVREWLGGSGGAESAPATLRLRGSWKDPIVLAAPKE